MKTVGIVAEYNPFHNGHAHCIAEAKRLTGAERAVIVMSGSFVQRGEPAMADKFTRARWALRNGADLVVELPEVFSCACAERFASGAVRLLAGTGLADCICFGSECGDIERLKAMADADIDPVRLRGALSSGLSYPAALAEAGEAPLSPNDILGVEYLRAVERHAPRLVAFAVPREGGYDETELNGRYSSAAAIRRALLPVADVQRMSERLFDELDQAMPADVLKDIAAMLREGLCPASDDRLSEVLLYRLRTMSAEEIAALPETAEGLENLFARHSVRCGEYAAMLTAVKSKRYTMARLKRICTCALLGVTEELQKAASADDAYLYLRVLGVRESSREMLAGLAEKASLPVIIQAGDRERLPEEALRVLRVADLAHKVHALAKPYENAAEEDAEHRLVTV